MLHVRCPDSYRPERTYIWQVILEDFLGLPTEISFEQRSDTLLLGGRSRRKLALCDGLFGAPSAKWLTEQTLPSTPLARWKIPSEYSLPFTDLPVLYGKTGKNGDFLTQAGDITRIGIDIAGSAFFMLTRYEELVTKQRDAFGRFTATNSLAYRENFLMRPLVNEYLELLWIFLQQIDHGLARRERFFELEPTHDVDIPYRLRPPKRLAKTLLGDLAHRHDPLLALRHLFHGAKASFQVSHDDPYDTYDSLMDQSERSNTRSRFYFMATGPYRLSSKPIQALLARINERGHEIGFHGNLGSSQDPQVLRSELEVFHREVARAGVNSPLLGGRQHYLSWDASQTWGHWEEVGLEFDSTCGFADHIGFRCGTCYPYRVFDIHRRIPLNLKERPLLAMDVTLFDYMSLSMNEAENRLTEIVEQVRLHKGVLITNWHNSWFDGRSLRKSFYQRAIGAESLKRPNHRIRSNPSSD